jgi:peptidoglycan/LPS O-acetylase OafA/YrhL
MTAATASKPRMYYLDWLRLFATASVFLYHTNRFFNADDWHVKNAQLSNVSSMFENALGAWIMPLMFLLSGAAVFYSLRSRSGSALAKERFMRLMVPFLTLGVLVFGPVQVYLERLSHGDFSGSFWQFIPQYFHGLYGFGGNFAWMGLHMWYLLFLFLYTMLLLPVFLTSRKGERGFVSRLASGLDRPWVLFSIFIPLSLLWELADAGGLNFSRQLGGWDILLYIAFLLLGYLLVANPRAMQTVKKYAFLSLNLAIASTVVWLILRYAVLYNGFFAEAELRIFVCWTSLLAILGMGARYLTANKPFLVYSNEAVLPFYILHQPFLLMIGYFVVQWNLPILAKYFIIGSLGFMAIMAVYEFAVRRLPALRFLFGMKQMMTKPIAQTEQTLAIDPAKD